MPSPALLLSGDRRIASEVGASLREAGHRVSGGTAPDDLWKHVTRQAYDVVIADRRLLGPDPMGAFERLRELPSNPEVVVLIAEDETRARAGFLAAGALAVLSRETPSAELSAALLALIERADEHRRVRERARTRDQVRLADIRTESPAMREILDFSTRVATADSSLLLLGETGAGKEYFARAIHASSLRHAGPFVPVHCAALSETLLESELFGHVQGAFTGASRYRRGYFELAQQGTVFLDEIGELSPALQVKLLRVLQDRQVHPVGAEKPLDVDVRLMAATSRDLPREMAEGGFRADLYYRLSVVSIRVPTLRERAEDIPALSRAYVLRRSREMRRLVRGIDDEALGALCQYKWPGNVRELMNVLERAVLLANGPEVTTADLPFSGRPPQSAALSTGTNEPYAAARQRVLDEFESAYLRGLLTRSRGRLGTAARAADLNPRTLYEKMRRYGISKEQFKEAERAG